MNHQWSHFQVRLAISRGELKRPLRCSTCATKKKQIVGHHDDYNFPLNVRWLCKTCHLKWHERNRAVNHQSGTKGERQNYLRYSGADEREQREKNWCCKLTPTEHRVLSIIETLDDDLTRKNLEKALKKHSKHDLPYLDNLIHKGTLSYCVDCEGIWTGPTTDCSCGCDYDDYTYYDVDGSPVAGWGE